MSIINQMLRDLDARAAGEQERAGLPPRLRPLPPTAQANRQSWRMLALGVGLGAALAGGAAFLLLPEAPPLPAPAASPPPAVPAPAAPLPAVAAPASAPPVAAPPPVQADSAEMKISTLLSLAQAPESERRPPPLPPPAPLPQAPAVKAVTVPSPPVASPAEMPKPPAPKPPVAAAQPPAPRSPPKAAPPVEAAPADAQIDKRAKGGQGRELAEAEYRKGMQAVKRGDNAAAAPLFQHALEFDPAHLKARQALLSVLVSGRQWAEAQEVAQAGLALDPSQSGWAMILARLQFEQGDAAGAASTLEKHAAYAQGDADYQGLFAYLLQKQQRPAEAAERFRAAVALRPGEGRWWFGLGLALEGAGRGGEAREAYLKAREAGNLPGDMAAALEQKLR